MDQGHPVDESRLIRLDETAVAGNSEKNERIRDAIYSGQAYGLFFTVIEIISDKRNQPDQGDILYERGEGVLWLIEYALPAEIRDNVYRALQIYEENGYEALEQFVRSPEMSEKIQGLKIAEIGGNIMKVFERYGASAWTTKDINQTQTGSTGNNRYINPSNYQNIIGDQQFDITYSSFVFDYGSDIEHTISPDEPLGVNYDGMMQVFARITKPNGVSLHFGHHFDEFERHFWDKYGAQFNASIQERGSDMSLDYREEFLKFVFQEEYGFEIVVIGINSDENFIVLRKLDNK